MTDADPPPFARSLLPPDETPYEKAHLEAQIEAWPLDIDAIGREGDPQTCDVDKLPFLAFDRGLVLWRDVWTEARKRDVVRDAWVYKRLEGTPLGVEAYLNLADGYLIAEVLPPARSFAVDDDQGLTHQQILDLMPQLRLYHHWPEKIFSYAYGFAGRNFADVTLAVNDQAKLLGRYPVVYDPTTGIETPLQIADVDQSAGSGAGTVTLARQGYGGTGAAFADACFADGRGFLGPPFTQDPIVFDLADPTLTTQRNPQPLMREIALADPSFVNDTYAGNDLGDIGTYDRLYLFTAARIPTSISPASAAAFANSSWIGLPPYTQILTAAIPGTPASVGSGAGFADSCFADGAFTFDADDHSNFDFAMTAINAGRRAGDRILVVLATAAAGARAATLPAIGNI